MGKTWISPFPKAQIRLGTWKTILSISKSYAQWKKVAFLKFKGNKKVLMKTITQIWMFSNQIHVMKTKEEIIEVL